MTDAKLSLWTKWRRFRRLPALDREYVFRAMVLLPLTEIGLRAIGFRRWKQFIEQFSPSAERSQIFASADELMMTERITRAAHRAERHGLGKPNCLERSLTLWWLLRLAGIEGELHIGARKNDSKFEAHAWVELRGTILNDSPEVHQHYARFDAPIAAQLDRSR
jgi:Transglutaminase-like superfamily